MGETATGERDRDLARLAENGIFLDKTVRLFGKAIFERPVRLMDFVSLFDSQIGAYSYVSSGTEVHHTTIGRYASIGDKSTIGPSEHPTDWLSTSPMPYQDVFNLGQSPDLTAQPRRRVEIGNDVWLGARCGVMSGVRIGNGAIVGFGAVVTKDVPPYAVVGGTPARVIKYRFPEKTIERLLSFAWWQFDLPAARRTGISIAWQDPERALDQLAEAEQAGRLPRVSSRAAMVQAG